VRAGNEVLDDVPQSPSVGKKGPDQEKPNKNGNKMVSSALDA